MERDCLDCLYATEGVKCSAGFYGPCREHRERKALERAATLAGVKVRTEYVFPPIPIREYDWSAVDDNTYEPGCPIGWGSTEQAAVDDLVSQLQE